MVRGPLLTGSNSLTSATVLRNSERKQNTSRNMRCTTPQVVLGQSIFACLMKSSDCSCPPVVGMQKGTGDLAQYTMRQTTPAMNTTTAT